MIAMTDFECFMSMLRADDFESLTPDLVSSLSRQYPFLSLPSALLLKKGEVTSDSALKTVVALNAPDTDTLMKLIDPDGERFSRFYPAEERQETPTTEKAIDTFLDNYGKIDPREEALLERLIFNPVPDYSQVLAHEASDMAVPEAVTEQDAMLDAFLAKQQHVMDEALRKENTVPDTNVSPCIAKPDPDSSLNESLAKMYIKMRKYDKAYEIIHQLSLNFPEKSVYFADQLRFLRKLIFNQQHAKA